MMAPLALQEFQALPTNHVARLVRASGPKVCVFPVNGTRRWYLLEHGQAAGAFANDYLRVSGQPHLQLFMLLFDHGLDTLVAPVFGPDLE